MKALAATWLQNLGSVESFILMGHNYEPSVWEETAKLLTRSKKVSMRVCTLSRRLCSGFFWCLLTFAWKMGKWTVVCFSGWLYLELLWHSKMRLVALTDFKVAVKMFSIYVRRKGRTTILPEWLRLQRWGRRKYFPSNVELIIGVASSFSGSAQ